MLKTRSKDYTERRISKIADIVRIEALDRWKRDSKDITSVLYEIKLDIDVQISTIFKEFQGKKMLGD